MKRSLLVPAVGLGLVLAACAAPEPVVEGEPGAHLNVLTPDEVRRFATGQADFNRPFSPEEGLGPSFNQDRCSSCHDLPTSGGHGAEPVTKVSRFDAQTGCDLLEDEGGDLLQQFLVEAAREAGLRPEQVPSSANGLTELVPPPVYGLGLVDHVAEADILSRADPEDRDGDGISGRPNVLADGSVGRFGVKAQHATLASFVEGATRGEMGLTTPAHPVEETINGEAIPASLDPASDPEVDDAFLASLTEYLRFLAPPVRRPFATGEEKATVDAGERTFERIGCGECHTPNLVTAPHESAALDGVRFRIYSDLLLHDMGPELADICGPGTTRSEWRTTRLVGLGLRFEFLHDGRAQRLSDAILLHGGEAEQSAMAFRALDADAQAALLRFLQSL